jgi:hypothetical protein
MSLAEVCMPLCSRSRRTLGCATLVVATVVGCLPAPKHPERARRPTPRTSGACGVAQHVQRE